MAKFSVRDKKIKNFKLCISVGKEVVVIKNKITVKRLLRIIRTVISILILFVIVSYLTYFESYRFFRMGTSDKMYPINEYLYSTEIHIDNASVLKATEAVAEVHNEFPPAFRKRLQSWRCILVSASGSMAVDAGYPIDKMNGYTAHHQHTVTLLNKPKNEISDYRETYAHEIGHVFAIECGYIDVSSEFKTLYEKHKDTYKSSSEQVDIVYITSDPSEFFAEIFAQYYLNRDVLSQSYPELADYMTDAIKQFQQKSSFGYRVKSSIVGHYRNISHRIQQNEEAKRRS